MSWLSEEPLKVNKKKNTNNPIDKKVHTQVSTQNTKHKNKAKPDELSFHTRMTYKHNHDSTSLDIQEMQLKTAVNMMSVTRLKLLQ